MLWDVEGFHSMSSDNNFRSFLPVVLRRRLRQTSEADSGSG